MISANIRSTFNDLVRPFKDNKDMIIQGFINCHDNVFGTEKKEEETPTLEVLETIIIQKVKVK